MARRNFKKFVQFSYKKEVSLNTPAILALEDQTLFQGISVGIDGVTCGEVVFNTAVTGYQEILTDPSYANQIVTFTFPHIGNVGVNRQDYESSRIQVSGLVIRNYSQTASNWRSEQTLVEFLKANQIVAISEIDTRHLTQILREKGVMRGCIMAGTINTEEALRMASECSTMKDFNLIQKVSTFNHYKWQEGLVFDRSPRTSSNFQVIVYDFGVKQSILRYLVNYGCHVLVVPPTIGLEEIRELNPDGILLSNGPGNPADLIENIAIIRDLIKTNIPIFGICLGHQLLALALSAKTKKMKFGHHGANHPVLDIETGRVFITSQNHGYVVDENSLPTELKVTHRSLFDGTVQGLCHKQKPIYSFQGHPEAAPGPKDADLLFKPLIAMMQKRRAKVEHYAETQ